VTFLLPQFGIFAQGTHAHHFLEFDLKPGIGAAQAVEAFRRLRTPDVSAGGVNLVVAFGAGIWQEVAPSATPADLTPFEPVGSDDRRAPATQHDAWLWISGAEPDVTWQSARSATRAVTSADAGAAIARPLVLRAGALPGRVGGAGLRRAQLAHDGHDEGVRDRAAAGGVEADRHCTAHTPAPWSNRPSR
jgi:porphyrinogen peroxidase